MNTNTHAGEGGTGWVWHAPDEGVSAALVELEAERKRDGLTTLTKKWDVHCTPDGHVSVAIYFSDGDVGVILAKAKPVRLQ